MFEKLIELFVTFGVDFKCISDNEIVIPVVEDVLLYPVELLESGDHKGIIEKDMYTSCYELYERDNLVSGAPEVYVHISVEDGALDWSVLKSDFYNKDGSPAN